LNNKEKIENTPMTIYGMNNNIPTTCLIPSTNIVKTTIEIPTMMKITKKKKGIKIKQLFNESLIDECETLFNKIHKIKSVTKVKTQNVDDFDGLEVTMDICSLLIY